MKVRNTTGRQVLVDDQFVRPGIDFVEVKATPAIKALVKAGVLEVAPEPEPSKAKADNKEKSA